MLGKASNIDDTFSKLADGIKKQRESAESEYFIQNKEPGLAEITSLEQATVFIKKRDREAYINILFLAHALKKVRDEKLYTEKYNTFEEYFSNELNYERRSIFNFLRIADCFPLDTKGEIVGLGVRKLLELSNPKLSDEEREKYMSENNLKEKLADEIRDDIKSIVKKQQRNSIQNPDIDGMEPEDKEIQQPGPEELSVSISSNELSTVSEFYSRFNHLLCSVDEFKQENENGRSVNKAKLEGLKELLENTRKDMKVLEKLIKKYI